MASKEGPLSGDEVGSDVPLRKEQRSPSVWQDAKPEEESIASRVRRRRTEKEVRRGRSSSVKPPSVIRLRAVKKPARPTPNWNAEPIVCTPKTPDARKGNIPAVRIDLEDDEWAVLPLSGTELGQVWTSAAQMTIWDCLHCEGGWSEARKGFRRLIRYPEELILTLVEALRTGKWEDGKEVTIQDWHDCVMDPSAKIHIVTRCNECWVVRELEPRHLISGVCDLSRFCCPQAGFLCNLGWGEDVRDENASFPRYRRNVFVRSGAVRGGGRGRT